MKIEELEALEKEATDAPWFHCDFGEDTDSPKWDAHGVCSSAGPCDRECPKGIEHCHQCVTWNCVGWHAEQDAKVIAKSRNALPVLLKMARLVRANAQGLLSVPACDSCERGADRPKYCHGCPTKMARALMAELEAL